MATGAGADAVAHVHHLGLADLAQMRSSGLGASGTTVSLSATAQADLKTLRADMQTLQSEVPAAIASAVQADQALIRSVLPHSRMGDWTTAGSQTGSQGPAGSLHGMRPFDNASGTLDSRMTSKLQKAGLTSAQVTQIATDFQNYQNALKTVDPTLSDQITTDLAQLKKDSGTAIPGLAGASGSLGGTLGSAHRL